jgi:hypothetical protein
MFAPPPPPNMQPNPLNTRTNNHPMIYQIVNNSGYPPCPFCNQSVPTIAKRVTGQAQIFWCFVLFLLAPCICCIPFCMPSCDDINYECSNCRRIVSVIIRPIC